MKPKKFKAKFTLDRQLSRGGRKSDSNYYRRRIAGKKVAYITHLAGSLEQLVVVVSFKAPLFKSGLVDRFLIFAHTEGLVPLLVFTKTDLVSSEVVEERTRLYAHLGYKVIPVSNKTQEGLASVRRAVKGRRSALVGHSGVGKTTLLNHIDPNFLGRTREVSSVTQKGRHTTKRIFLYELSFGGSIFDMPGLKEMDFVGLSKRDLSLCYREFGAFAGNCRFANCLHLREEPCGVKKAVEEGKIPSERYANYVAMLGQLMS